MKKTIKPDDKSLQYIINPAELQRTRQAVTKQNVPAISEDGESNRVGHEIDEPDAVESSSGETSDDDQESPPTMTASPDSLDNKSGEHNLSLFQGGNGTGNKKDKIDDKGKSDESVDNTPVAKAAVKKKIAVDHKSKSGESIDESSDAMNEAKDGSSIDFSDDMLYTEIVPLNLKKVTAQKLISLKLKCDSAQRRMGVDPDTLFSFTEAQRLLQDQLTSAEIALAKREICGDVQAEAILAEYNDACREIYQNKIAIIGEYDRELILSLDLHRLRRESQRSVKMTRIESVSSLQDTHKIKEDFNRQKFITIIRRLEEMAKEGDEAARDKLMDYRASSRQAQEIQRINLYAHLHFRRLIEKSTMAEVCSTLANQISYPSDNQLQDLIHNYIKNNRCTLAPIVRQSFALAVIYLYVSTSVETTAKKVPIYRDEPKFITEIKAIFRPHVNSRFDNGLVIDLLLEISKKLGQAVSHYEGKRERRTVRWFQSEIDVNERLILSFKNLKEWVDATMEQYLHEDVVVPLGLEPVVDHEGAHTPHDSLIGEFTLMSPYSDAKK